MHAAGGLDYIGYLYACETPDTHLLLISNSIIALRISVESQWDNPIPTIDRQKSKRMNGE